MAAAAVVGGAVIGGVASNSAASKSAKASKKATNSTVGEQRRQFDLIRQDTAGQRALGEGATSALSRLYGFGTPPGDTIDATQQSDGTWAAGAGGMYGRVIAPQAQKSPAQVGNGTPDLSGFFESPDYQYNVQQSEKAINRAQAAGGRFNSGRAGLELTRNASGLASGEYNNFTQRLLQMAGIGGQGIGTSANAGLSTAANIGNAYQNAGNARASAYANGAAGVNNSVQGGISNYLLNSYLKGSGGGGGAVMADNYQGPIYGNYA